MALYIDTAQLAQNFIPEVQNNLDGVTGGVRRFQVHRVCAHATVIPCDLLDSSRFLWFFPYFIMARSLSPEQGTLDWQADPDDDLDEVKVLHHLHQQAASSPHILKFSSRKSASTRLVASAMSPSFKARTHGRLVSSFHRYSLRCLNAFRTWLGYIYKPSETKRESAISRILPNVLENPLMGIFTPDLEIVWASDGCEYNSLVIWWVQVDVVDLFSQKTPTTSRPVKRRRTAVNPFLQVSDSAVVEDTSPENHLPHVKRYNGVRYRPDRRTWVAEMKPPKHKNKEDFGSFKSEAQAARAVDEAFHHYGTPHRLNFPDTARILSTRPTAAAGLDEKAMLKFVKEEAKWLASRVTLEFRSISEISASVFSWGGGADEADDAVSHPPPVSTTGVETVDPNYFGTEELGAVGTLQEGQGMSVWSLEVIADTDYLANSSHDSPSMWVDYFISSPPALDFE